MTELDLMTPPAIVQKMQDLASYVNETKIMYGAFHTTETSVVPKAAILGKRLMDLEELCEPGLLESEIKKTGIPRNRAYEFREIAKCPNPRALKMPSIYAALKFIKESAWWCARCTKIGEQTQGCHACEDSRSAAGIGKPKTGKSPTVYNKTKLWKNYNHFDLQVGAFVGMNKLKTHEKYDQFKILMAQVRSVVQDLHEAADEPA